MNDRMHALRVVLQSMWNRAGGRYALIMMGLWLLVSAVSLAWTPYSLLATDGFNTWGSPSSAHLLGTDGVGADVLSWLMAGSRTNLMIAVLTVAVSAAFGLLLVAAMVSRHGAFSSVSVVVVDALISIPTVLVALILSVPFGASAVVIVAACGFAYGLKVLPLCWLHVRHTWNRPYGREPARFACSSRILCRTRCRYCRCSCR